MTKDEYISKAQITIKSSNYPNIDKYTMIMILKMLVNNDKKKTNYSETDFTEEFLKSLHSEVLSDNKNLRKLLDLPITKELRYMKKEKNYFIPYKVISYQLVDWYTDSNSASLEITLENGQTKRILGDYFSHMQKLSFEKDIHDLEEKIN